MEWLVKTGQDLVPAGRSNWQEAPREGSLRIRTCTGGEGVIKGAAQRK